jgi:hypothetical protein
MRKRPKPQEKHPKPQEKCSKPQENVQNKKQVIFFKILYKSISTL